MFWLSDSRKMNTNPWTSHEPTKRIVETCVHSWMRRQGNRKCQVMFSNCTTNLSSVIVVIRTECLFEFDLATNEYVSGDSFGTRYSSFSGHGSIPLWRGKHVTNIYETKSEEPYSFKYNQQDATLYNIIYYCQCSTCFRRFLRPSSGAQKLYTQHRVYAKLACCYR